MKMYRLVLASFLLMLAAAVVFAGEQQPSTPAPKTDTPAVATINWVPFDEGLKRAEAEKKNILVDLTASWCGWCKKMEKEAFADTTIIKTINANYIPVKVWGDSDKLLDIKGYKISEKDLATGSFGVQGYPTFFVLCPDARGIKRFVGYRPADAFMEELSQVIGFNCDSAKAADEKKTNPGTQPGN